jgi:hypothetical protein
MHMDKKIHSDYDFYRHTTNLFISAYTCFDSLTNIAGMFCIYQHLLPCIVALLYPCPMPILTFSAIKLATFCLICFQLILWSVDVLLN